MITEYELKIYATGFAVVSFIVSIVAFMWHCEKSADKPEILDNPKDYNDKTKP